MGEVQRRARQGRTPARHVLQVVREARVDAPQRARPGRAPRELAARPLFRAQARARVDRKRRRVNRSHRTVGIPGANDGDCDHAADHPKQQDSEPRLDTHQLVAKAGKYTGTNHIGNNNISTFISQLNRNEYFTVKEAEEKEIIKEKTIYFAPPNYHLQIEDKNSLSLSTAQKVNFSRPSIDVLFETAAWTFKHQLLGILLTGSNSDGAEGLKTIKKFGGTTIVENPETAYAKTMPQSAIKKSAPDFILNLDKIAEKMIELTGA